MAKKILAKDLKRDEIADEIIHAGEEALHWTERHRGPLIGGAAGIIVLGLAIGGFAWWKSGRENAVEAKLAEAMRLMDDVEKPAQPEDAAAKPKATWDQVVTTLQDAVKEGPGTPGSRLARLQLGYVQLRSGKAAEAVTTLEALSRDASDAWMAPHALAALAAAQEQAGDAAGAEATLKKLDAGTWKTWPKSASLMLLGEYYRRQGNADAAKDAFRKLSTDAAFADSPYLAPAQQALTDLGG